MEKAEWRVVMILTIDQGVEDELPIFLDEVIDVAKYTTGRISVTVKHKDAIMAHTTCWKLFGQ